ncbi:hypothetical protein TH53_09850 [Pedobacter lusitanus]|uniref:Uncharacterized protein n=2 Tax=Pedobacter lusitanus TaxID=1503925 RepID=A0A0D0F715_9SPHI|nr:hypothetical protein TH53_09850 [Pedobacter lusitanus]
MELSDCIAGRIRQHGPVSFHEFMEWCLYDPEIYDIIGCVRSNELVDNFAVHRMAMEKELREVYVDY